MNKLIFIIFFTLTSLCYNAFSKDVSPPSWYNNPTQNNSKNIYGIAEGNNLEEATRYALADAAARLIVSISSESNLIREENQNSVNEEIRQRVKQSVEKISFSNFKVSRSASFDQRFFVEIEIEKEPFINEQKERLSFVEKKISDLNSDSLNKNQIQRRNALIKILDLSKEVELKSRIIAGAGEKINLKEKLTTIANFQNQFDKSSDKIEFYFDINSPKAITKILRNGLNKEKIKIAVNLNSSNPNQVIIKIKSSSKTNKIYEAFITKIEIDFENFVAGKILASNSIEITGSSSINETESYAAALSNFEEKLDQDGALKIIGIIN